MSEVMCQAFLKDFTVKTSGKRTTYLVNLETLRNVGAKKWKSQRPADEARVAEIRAGIEACGDVGGILCMAWHPEQNLIVYDGQHRWQALLSIENPEIRVFVEILWDCTEEEIVAAFKTANACVPVSELYLQDEARDVRQEIADIVRKISETCSGFVSTSKKPKRPQFNRDILTQELYEIWSDTFEKERSIADIWAGLKVLNTKYHADMLSIPRQVTVKKHPTIYEKCHAHGFWLFAESGSINRDHLRTVMGA